jgi:hypothetical protein
MASIVEDLMDRRGKVWTGTGVAGASFLCWQRYLRSILLLGGNVMDRFAKTCLVLIIVLLAVIAAALITSPHSVQAQAPGKYLAVRSYGGGAPSGSSIQGTLDKYAADGWELVAPIYMEKDVTGNTGELYLIFRH